MISWQARGCFRCFHKIFTVQTERLADEKAEKKALFSEVVENLGFGTTEVVVSGYTIGWKMAKEKWQDYQKILC